MVPPSWTGRKRRADARTPWPGAVTPRRAQLSVRADMMPGARPNGWAGKLAQASAPRRQTRRAPRRFAGTGRGRIRRHHRPSARADDALMGPASAAVDGGQVWFDGRTLAGSAAAGSASAASAWCSRRSLCRHRSALDNVNSFRYLDEEHACAKMAWRAGRVGLAPSPATPRLLSDGEMQRGSFRARGRAAETAAGRRAHRQPRSGIRRLRMELFRNETARHVNFALHPQSGWYVPARRTDDARRASARA